MQTNADAVTATLDRSVARYRKLAGISDLSEPVDTHATVDKQETNVADKKTASVKTAGEMGGSQLMTTNDAGDYGTAAEALNAQKKETREEGEAGTDAHGSQNMSMNLDDENYTLNGSARLAVIQAVKELGKEDPEAMVRVMRVATGGSRKQADDGNADANVGPEAGGVPDEVEAADDEKDMANAAPATPPQANEAPASGMQDAALSGELAQQIRQLEEQEAVDKAVLNKLKEIAQGGGLTTTGMKKIVADLKTQPLKVLGWVRLQLKKAEALKVKKAGSKRLATKAFDVFLNGEEIDTVFYNDNSNVDEEEVKRSLINHDGYDSGIEVVLHQKSTSTEAKKAKQAADSKATGKVKPMNVPPTSMQDIDGDEYELADGDVDASVEKQIKGKSDKSGESHDGQEALDTGDYPVTAAKSGWDAYDKTAALLGVQKTVAAGKKTANEEESMNEDSVEAQSWETVPLFTINEGQIPEGDNPDRVAALREFKESGSMAGAQFASDEADWDEAYAGEMEGGQDVDSALSEPHIDWTGFPETKEGRRLATKPAPKKASVTVHGQPLKTKKSAENTSPPDIAASAGGDEENRYESALQGDTAEDETAEGNLETKESPETKSVVDQAESFLDSKHRDDTRGATMARLFKPAEREAVVRQLKAVSDTQKVFAESARLATATADPAKRGLVAMARQTQETLSNLNKKLAHAMKAQAPAEVARKRFIEALKEAAIILPGVRKEAVYLDALRQIEAASQERSSRVVPVMDMAIRMAELGHAPDAVRGKIAEYMEMPRGEFKAAYKATAEMMASMTRRPQVNQSQFRTAARLPAGISSGSNNGPSDPVDGIFDE